MSDVWPTLHRIEATEAMLLDAIQRARELGLPDMEVRIAVPCSWGDLNRAIKLLKLDAEGITILPLARSGIFRLSITGAGTVAVVAAVPASSPANETGLLSMEAITFEVLYLASLFIPKQWRSDALLTSMDYLIDTAPGRVADVLKAVIRLAFFMSYTGARARLGLKPRQVAFWKAAGQALAFGMTLVSLALEIIVTLQQLIPDSSQRLLTAGTFAVLVLIALSYATESTR